MGPHLRHGVKWGFSTIETVLFHFYMTPTYMLKKLRLFVIRRKCILSFNLNKV